MNQQPVQPDFGADLEIIFDFDETNGQIDHTRRPLSENRRKAIEERLERAERLMRAWEVEQEANGRVSRAN